MGAEAMQTGAIALERARRLVKEYHQAQAGPKPEGVWNQMTERGFRVPQARPYMLLFGIGRDSKVGPLPEATYQ